MESIIKKALDNWVKGANPISAHFMDMNRFYELVYECIKEDYILTQEDIADAMKEHLSLIDTKVKEESIRFEEKAEAIFGFVGFLNDKKDIDVKSIL